MAATPAATPAAAASKRTIKRCLVAGGAGFVGSHLCTRLVEEGHDVICLDSLLTGERSNVAHLVGRPNFHFMMHDIREPVHVEVDQIFNLACPAAPIHYQSYPIKTWETCVLGTRNLLQLALEVGATFLQASTSEVYGEPLVHPQVEGYWGNVSCTGPRACYDEGKRAAEALIFDYYRVYKLPVRVIRIFNTYGPRMHPFDGRVVSNFVRQALRGEPITIYGDGKQSRSFQYVDDLLEGMLRMMNNTSGFIGPVNIGNPVEFTVSELADLVIEKTGADKSLVKYLPRPTDDPTQRKPDISLAREKLEGWAPKVPLAEGLDRLIEWMRTVDFDNVRVPALWEAGLATIAKK